MPSTVPSPPTPSPNWSRLSLSLSHSLESCSAAARNLLIDSGRSPRSFCPPDTVAVAYAEGVATEIRIRCRWAVWRRTFPLTFAAIAGKQPRHQSFHLQGRNNARDDDDYIVIDRRWLLLWCVAERWCTCCADAAVYMRESWGFFF